VKGKWLCKEPFFWHCDTSHLIIAQSVLAVTQLMQKDIGNRLVPYYIAKKSPDMKRIKKILKWIGIIILVLIIGLVGTVYALQYRDFDAPVPDIKASTDSAVIARGKYLAYGAAHCNFCHASPKEIDLMKKGEKLPLAGGYLFDLPIGKIYTPNLTPDSTTGIGRYTDAQLARALRYGVNHNNKAMFQFMPFQNLSDEDLTAVISYIRSMPAVKREVPEREYNFLGKAISAFFIRPVGPTGTPPKSVKQDSSAAYGEYLANSIANCRGCHTPRDPLNGDFTGPDFSGGVVFEGEKSLKGKFITPNISFEKETGHISTWSEKVFIDRFRRGRSYEGSPMPWESFSNLSDNDLKAVYRYLKSVKPVYNKTGPVFTPDSTLVK
jgi:mono/diheme cytochrome c family protein